MNIDREKVIEFASKAGVAYEFLGDVCPAVRDGCDMTDELMRFAALVEQHEREQCAQVCEAIEEEADRAWEDQCDPYDQGRSHGSTQCARDIRARGTKDAT